MRLSSNLSINKDIIKIYYNRNIKLLHKNLIDIILKASWNVRSAKKYKLVSEITVSNINDSLLFIIFSNSHLIICTIEIYPDK